MSTFLLNLEKKLKVFTLKSGLQCLRNNSTQSSLMTTVGTDKLGPGVPSSAEKNDNTPTTNPELKTPNT